MIQRLLCDHLVPDGKLVIGDIAFSNAAEQDQLRKKMGSEWDQEFYWWRMNPLKPWRLKEYRRLFPNILLGVYLHSTKGDNVNDVE